MSTLFGKLGLRKRRNKIVTGTVFSAAAAALVAIWRLRMLTPSMPAAEPVQVASAVLNQPTEIE